MLQQYVFIPLDIFKKNLQNKGITGRLDAWLLFLSVDNPEQIEMLLEKYLEFQKLYEEVYEICENVERVMEMFSKELQELDRNTVQYMIDEMQDTIDTQDDKIRAMQSVLSEQEEKLRQGIHGSLQLMREFGVPEEQIVEKLTEQYRISKEETEIILSEMK